MVDVIIHFRGVGPQRQELPAVPAVGTYIFGPGEERRLWRVEAVAIDGGAIHLFCIEVARRSAAELAAAWAAWGGVSDLQTEGKPAGTGGNRPGEEKC